MAAGQSAGMQTRTGVRSLQFCEHSVSRRSVKKAVPDNKLPLTCGSVVGMRGFEPRISGPPDRRPGPNWATSRCTARQAVVGQG